MLLLDEPTNHLDIDAKTWLLNFLRNYKGALLVISHDLELLDEAITRVIHLDRPDEDDTGMVFEYRGTYTQYKRSRAEDESRAEKKASLQAKEVARLQEVVETCLDAYDKLEFHRVYHTINQFCAVDLSSLYVDITKDRLYCDQPASPRRRATQFAMHTVFDALVRLLAPILAFTAEEAWGYCQPDTSVHLQDFPQPDPAWTCPEALQTMEQLLQIRARIAQALEKPQKAGEIGSALEARVRLGATPAEIQTLAPLRTEAEEIFILSDLEIHEAETAVAEISKTPSQRCERCWRHRPEVGASATHPTLCQRCEAAVTSQA